MSILIATAIIPLIAVLVILRFLPGEIPAHFDINMNIDRWGSKYEILIMPAVIIVQSVLVYIFALRSERSDSSGSNRKVILIVGVTMNVLFAGITAFQVLYALKADRLEAVNEGFSLNAMFILMGLAIAVMENFLPKCKMNSSVGLRTEWSMANEDVWSECQRFGGVLMVVCGIAMTVLSALIKSTAGVIAVNLIILVIMSVLAYTGSKRIYTVRCKK